MTAAAVTATSPVTRRVRAYFAPVDRVAGAPTIFDAAQLGAFLLDQPPAPWIDLGWCAGFTRKSGTKVNTVSTGAPATVQEQVRGDVEATLSLRFESWGKLQLALASGSQQMNLLATTNGAAGKRKRWRGCCGCSTYTGRKYLGDATGCRRGGGELHRRRPRRGRCGLRGTDRLCRGWRQRGLCADERRGKQRCPLHTTGHVERRRDCGHCKRRAAARRAASGGRAFERNEGKRAVGVCGPARAAAFFRSGPASL